MSIYSVSAITTYIRESLESDELLGDLWVSGEVSNWSRPPSGHIYFTLKDASASLKCVLWRSFAARLQFQPRDGDAVVLHGRVTVYEPRGEYQLQVDLVQPEGTGLLYQAYEELKRRLEAEGLFDASRKRPLPRFPRRIGVVTSPTGAVLHDIVNVLGRRYPLAHLLLAPAAMQGLEAPGQIVDALATLNADGKIDVIIVARGGGSLEDLWAFNDERVARAIAGSAAPVISAVGHETDFTIADFVADVRAPTPSAAAELVAPDVRDLQTQVTEWEARLQLAAGGRVQNARGPLLDRLRLLRRFAPDQVVARLRQRVDELTDRAGGATPRQHAILLERRRGLTGRLSALSPYATLARGYAVVRRAPDGEVVTRVVQAAGGQRLLVRVSDGEFGAVSEGDREVCQS